MTPFTPQNLHAFIVACGKNPRRDFDGRRVRIGIELDEMDDPMGHLADLVASLIPSTMDQRVTMAVQEGVRWLITNFEVYTMGRRERAVFNMDWPEDIPDPEDE